jgi:hypothetical protein
MKIGSIIEVAFWSNLHGVVTQRWERGVVRRIRSASFDVEAKAGSFPDGSKVRTLPLNEQGRMWR